MHTHVHVQMDLCVPVQGLAPHALLTVWVCCVEYYDGSNVASKFVSKMNNHLTLF